MIETCHILEVICFCYLGKRGSLVTPIAPPPPVRDLESVTLCKLELDFTDLEELFLLNLMGRICNRGFCSVPEFSTANW